MSGLILVFGFTVTYIHTPPTLLGTTVHLVTHTAIIHAIIEGESQTGSSRQEAYGNSVFTVYYFGKQASVSEDPMC